MSKVDDLRMAAKAVVDAISLDEWQHGGLISRETLVKVNVLRRIIAEYDSAKQPEIST